MRLGLLGGTFDPVHYGHLILADQCREQARLERVWFVPAAQPPHKSRRPVTPGRQRVEMLELALAGNEAFEVCRLELERGGMSYTVETLEHLRREEPGRELFFLIGSDSLADLPTWHEPRRILGMATVVVAARPGTPLDLQPVAAALGRDAAEQIQRHCVEMPAVGISSSDIRRRVRAGRSIRYLLPPAVECYVAENGLYREVER